MRRNRVVTDMSGGDPPPYSLPCVSELSSHDDWTTVTERTAKKRIQNRVAQRTYRQRMKDRIAELQAKLDKCEEELRSKNSVYQDGHDGSPESPTQRRDSSSPLVHSAAKRCSTPTDSASLPGNSTTTTELDQQNLFELSNYFSLESCDGSNIREKDGEHILPLPATGYAQAKELRQSTIVETNGEAPAQQSSSRLSNDKPDSLTFGDSNNLESYLNGAFSPSTSSTLISPVQQVPLPDDVRVGGQRDGDPNISMAMNAGKPRTSSCEEGPHLNSNSAGMDIDERVSCVITYLEAMGFENFDELARMYYCQHFGEASVLSNEQRLSRNRRLPGVIASVFCATTKWSTWERRGFHEEVLKATEAMLVSEGLEAQADLQTGAARVLESPICTLPSVTSKMMSLKKSITSELPNLWALMMALTSSTNRAWNKDTSGIALAAILLLQCAGRMEKTQVLELVRLCL